MLGGQSPGNVESAGFSRSDDQVDGFAFENPLGALRVSRTRRKQRSDQECGRHHPKQLCCRSLHLRFPLDPLITQPMSGFPESRGRLSFLSDVECLGA
jgi:hypothetical protein